VTQVPNSKKYEKKALSVGEILTSPYGLVRPVQVAIVRGGVVVAKGFAEGNLRVQVRRQVSRARRAQLVNRDVRPVVGGSLDGVIDRFERVNRWGDRYTDRSWKCNRQTQYKPISHEIVLDW
jgi:hypothetical protein